ncbi:MAG: DHHW family protein [Eubacteriales bacterium]|nr:DHHW family protein [Eubacteriales bacterium]
MKKNSAAPRLLPAFFAALILVMGILLAVLPRQDFSPLEKRYLAKPPALTMEGGQFSRDIEAFLGDHFPFRANWVGLDAQRRLLSGTMAADEVWRLKDGALVQAPLPRDWERLERNLALLSEFAKNAGLPLTLVCPPAAGAVSGQEGYFPWPDGEVIKRLEESPPGTVQAAPLFEAFSRHASPLYYRTDPHWNGEGAYLAYRQAAPLLGFDPIPASVFTVSESPGFLGSNYSRSGLWATPPDTLAMWDAGQNLEITFDNAPDTYASLFFPEHLEEPDQYPVFLDGNHGLSDIRNLDNPRGPVLMMLKDSFGNSLAPLLVPHYSRVIILDLRAWRQSPLRLAREAGCDQILAVYSLDSLATDANLAWLGQE